MLLKIVKVTAVIGMILMYIIGIFYYNQPDGRISIAVIGICEIILYLVVQYLELNEES